MNINTLIIAGATTALLCAGHAFGQAAQPAATPAAQPAAEPAANTKTIGTISSNAQAELTKTIAQLSQMRGQIAKDKLPMAQELTGLEEQVIALRKDADSKQRLVDEGALEIGTLQLDIKARQDELVYISGLLDEYTRNFEAKLGVGEQQLFGKAVDAVKQAAENHALTPTEHFATQTTLVDITAKRLFDVLGGTRFAGVGVDTMGTVMKGQFAMIGPISLFRSDAGAAGVAVPQAGSTNPLVRPLEGELSGAIGSLVATGAGTLPLDPSRGGALKALIQKTSLWHLFEKGGPIMWPLLISSIIALAVVVERVLFLLNEQRKRSPKMLAQFFTDITKGDLAAAIALSSRSRDAIVETLGYALAHRDQSLSHALTYAETRTLKRYRRGIAVLDTVITLAPLLGLLGTVTGMMGSFAVIGGDLSSPGAITGGIAEALIATAFGLMIAIVALLPFNYLNNRIEMVEMEMLGAGEQLKLLVEGRVIEPRKPITVEPNLQPAAAAAGGI